MNTNKKTFSLVLTALFTAIIVAMAFTPLGYIPLVVIHAVSDSNVNDVTHNSKVNDNFKASKDFEDVVNHPTSFNGNNTSTNIESIPRSLNKTFNLKKPRRK